MRYTHDERKRAANLKKHGDDFTDAPMVIESNTALMFEDQRLDCGE